jgi:acetylxylan esterase
MAFISYLVAALAAITVLPTVLGAANSLIPVSNFGTNPSNVTMYLYLPTVLAPNPPILVNPHWCHGSAQAAFTGTQLATLADTYGYIMIFPNSPNTVDMCWDVSSNATLSHNGGGDSLGIVSMVKYTLATYGGDPNRVFAMGTSSGAMMTNVLIGAYPDVFAAGSAWAGVAFGCFADPAGGVDVWNAACAEGDVIKTGVQWEAIVDAAYPGYYGFRPKMQVFHGTNDTTLYPQNLQEEIKEWTTVLGLPSSPVRTENNWPDSEWTTYVYGSTFTATSAAGVTHDIQTNASVVLDWFDLTCQGSGCYSRTNPGGGSGGGTSTSVSSVKTSSTSSTSSIGTTTSSASATASTVPKWGQCGGNGYTGSTVCVAGSTCTFSNAWYSQCL